MAKIICCFEVVLPVFVAGDGDVVDVVREVERRGVGVDLVIERPVLDEAVVLQLRVWHR